jgi:hypothetical protein
MAATAPDQLDFPIDQHETDGLYEVIDGRIVEKTTGAYECWLASVIFGALEPYNTANPIGRVVQEMIFDLRPHVDRERRSDVAYVSFAVRVLAPGDELDGGDVLPGFRLPMQDLIDKAGEPA